MKISLSYSKDKWWTGRYHLDETPLYCQCPQEAFKQNKC